VSKPSGQRCGEEIRGAPHARGHQPTFRPDQGDIPSLGDELIEHRNHIRVLELIDQRRQPISFSR
jgi:hypothetical protein